MTMSSTDTSNFDIDFSIPIISETPTLEEILKEDDSFKDVDQIIEQELNLPLISHESMIEPILMNHNENHKESNFNVSSLDTIKNQLTLSKSDKVGSGNPTALTVSKDLIAIGTFNGHILIFDSEEKLAGFLKHDKGFGSVSSLSINKDQNKLICGGSKGLVSLWNLANYEIIRVVEDLHAPFSSILVVQYLSNQNFAILNDTSGSVFLLDVQKKDFDSQCIFSGSRGEALMLKPLSHDTIPSDVAMYNGLDKICLIAMATVSKVIVISLRPSVIVHYTFTLKGNLDFLPLICWNLSFDFDNRKLPLLTFGRQNQLYIHRMVTDFIEKIDFLPLFQFTMSNFHMQHVSWIENEKIFVMDTSENGHLIDVFAREELESVDLSHIELVYENANYKSLANGGYVSRAMARAGEHACNNSFYLKNHPQKNRLYALGLKSVFTITLNDWHEKVDHYLQEKNYSKALKLLYENYLYFKEREKFSSKSESDFNEILSKMDLALNNFDEYIFDPSLVSYPSYENKLREIIQIYLKYSVCLPSKHEKVFELYEKIPENSTIKSILIECLESFIFDEEFPNLNPVIVKEMIDHYIKKEWYNLLDSLLTHLEITSLDIDQILRIYSSYKLYDSFIYIYNCALEDFIFPFDTLLKILSDSIKSKSQPFSKDDIIIGNKLLVYLNCMLTCVYYPNNKGKISQEKQVEHLNFCYRRLTQNNDNNSENCCMHVFDVLFQYDCIEFLNILLIAFDFLNKNHTGLLHWKQVLIDQMILFVLDDRNHAQPEYRNSFFIFLGRCSTDSSDSIKIKSSHFEQMINSLFEMKNKRFEERQQILIQIFKSDRFKHKIDKVKFLENAQKSQMFKICELIYQNDRDWINLLGVYISDPSKHEEIFSYIDCILAQEDFFQEKFDKANFLNYVFENIHFLVKVDCLKSAELFLLYINHCDNLFESVVEKLQSDTFQLYQFLNQIILKNRLEYDNNLSFDSNKLKIIELCLDSKNQEKFIELACEVDPDQVIIILNSLKEYDKLNALYICQKFGIRQGEAILYEKMKQYSKSFKILFENFKQSIDSLMNWKNQVGSEIDTNFDTCTIKFDELLKFCDRITKNGKDKLASQEFWLELLEYLIKVRTSIKTMSTSKPESRKYQNFIVKFNRHINSFFEKLVSDMLANMNLVEFLEIIMNKILKQSDSMCDIRETLLLILENYNYEKTLLELTTNILSVEHCQLIQNLIKTVSNSNKVKKLKCNICLKAKIKTIRKTSKKLMVFSGCHHLFHLDCIETLKSDRGQENISCPACNERILMKKHHYLSSPSNLPPTSFATTAASSMLSNEISNSPDSNNKKSIKSTKKKPYFNSTQLRILNNLHNGRLRRIRS